MIISYKDFTFQSMNDWLQQIYLEGMTKVKLLDEIIKDSIEHFVPLKNEILLQESNIFLNEMSIFPSNHASNEMQEDFLDLKFSSFTVCQLQNISYQLEKIAPLGTITPHLFMKTITSLLQCEDYIEYFPIGWMRNLFKYLPYISSLMMFDGEYLSWKKFVLLLSQPWPLPSLSKLLEALSHFCKLDQLQTGFLSKEQLLKAELWLKKATADVDAKVDQIDEMLSFYFNLYADRSSGMNCIGYVQFLLYFCLDEDPYKGFIKALSVAMGKDMSESAEKNFCEMSSSEDSTESTQIDLLTLHQEMLSYIYKDYDKDGKIADWRNLKENSLLQYMLMQLPTYKYHQDPHYPSDNGEAVHYHTLNVTRFLDVKLKKNCRSLLIQEKCRKEKKFTLRLKLQPLTTIVVCVRASVKYTLLSNCIRYFVQH
ncbi:hypothetical protein HELRODRAFT_189863 [Helobdella robusta]|uniref:SPEF2 C-terminal domain-containing protein n=1 Tax=Helobdella robusta TaxID=6412 RepID=T1FRF5_HELRO|nr:hypothetical protein HELRODRAFT_189863 [Helobdella robusta]ESN90461.1 hypothetical protein HELRODRAFT_189863 [Helobdella robusta]